MTSATAATDLLAHQRTSMDSYLTTMETIGGPQVFSTPRRRVASPPATPDSSESPAARRARIAQSSYKRQGLYGGFQFSPPSDDGNSQAYSVRASTPELLNVPRSSSRPSTSSGLDDSPRRGRSNPDFDARSETSNAPSSILYWRSEEFEIVIEELLDDDPRSMRSSGLLRPDRISEAGSERAPSPSYRIDDDMVKRIEELHCDEEEETKREMLRKWRKKKDRWSTRSKRTWSESHGSVLGTDDAFSIDLDNSERITHPAKRRNTGLAQRASLVFDDPPPGHITEVDETEDEAVLIDAPPPYAEFDWSDLGLLQILPFGILPDSESDYTSSDEEED